MDIHGNTVLITGGSSGIGAELAKQFLEADNQVIVCARDPGKLADIAECLPTVETAVCDISDASQVAALHASFGDRVNVLINNTSIIQQLSLFEAPDLDQQLNEININLIGTLRMIQTFVPGLLQKPRAAIVNVSSGLAFIPDAGSPIYCATKAAQHSLTRTLRHQLRDTPVKVFELIPPATVTPMAAHIEGIPKLSPEKAASALIKGMARDKKEIGPGLARTIKIMSRLMPGVAFSLLNR